MAAGAVELRARRSGDLPVLLALLQRTHEQVRYPVRAEAVSDGWLASADELGGWVAVQDGRVLGHVALHPAGDDDAARGWHAAVGPVDLAVVSRLFTDGTVPGTGLALLVHAVEHAQDLAREAVLLVDPDSPARHWYLRHGWREAGTAAQQWGERAVDAVLMVQAS